MFLTKTQKRILDIVIAGGIDELSNAERMFFEQIDREFKAENGYSARDTQKVMLYRQFRKEMDEWNRRICCNPFKTRTEYDKFNEELDEWFFKQTEENQLEFCNAGYGEMLSMLGQCIEQNPCQPWQWEKGDIIAPAGALVSSMEDLLKFAKMNMDGSLPYADMLHQKYADGEKSFDQGLAWRIKKGTDISFHVGSAGAFSCILAMDRKKKQAAVIGLNYALVDIEEAAFSMLE